MSEGLPLSRQSGVPEGVPARIYCAVAQPPEGGVPVTAITTVHKDDYDAILRAYDRARHERSMFRAALMGMVGLYREDDGGVYAKAGASPADDALIAALAVLYPEEAPDA